MSNSSENFRAASGMVTVESGGLNIAPKIVSGNVSASKSVTYISGASPQDVIKNFMASLDKTNLSGEAALDEAISACSNGAFNTIQEAIDQMVSDCRTSSSANVFLADYCGIDLSNADTGAITGSDAGSSTTKTAESVVPESGSLINFTGNSFSVGGLDVYLVKYNGYSTTDYTRINVSDLNATQKYMWQSMYTWWTSGSLDLIAESYGSNFGFDSNSSATASEIYVGFYDYNDNSLAWTMPWYDSEYKTVNKLGLGLSTYYYGNLSTTNPNGYDSTSGQAYLDRVVSHEMTHAVMMANINYFRYLPQFLTEGLAELTHGIDDSRTTRIKELAGSASRLKSALFLTPGTGNSDCYAGGYMFLRYLAKQGALTTEDGLRINNTVSGASLTGSSLDDKIQNSGSSVTITAGGGNDTIKNNYSGDSSQINGGEGDDNIYSVDEDFSTISGGAGDDTIYGYYWNSSISGGAGADKISVRGGNGNTISGGTGDDTIYGASRGFGRLYQYAQGDGNDVIYGFSDKDTLHITSGTFTTLVSGYDFIVNVGSSKITLKNASASYSKSNKVRLVDAAGNVTVYNDWTIPVGTEGNDSINNVVDYATIDALGGNDTITNSGSYSSITGGAGNDSIYNTAYYSTLEGGAGNDTIYNTSYSTKIFGSDGNDSIYSWNGYVTIDGGAGDDTISAYNYGGRIDGGAGNDKISLYSYDYGNTVSGGAGNDTVYFSGSYGRIYQYASGDGADTIFGFSANDTINITSGNFTTLKSGEDFIINVGNGAITLKNVYANEYYRVKILGSDGTLTTVGLNVMSGTDGNDSLRNSANDISVLGGGGNDYIYNSGNNAEILGGGGSDSIYNYGDYSYVDGGSDADYIYSYDEDGSTISGGDGDDTISGRYWNAKIYGGAGNDSILLGSGGYYNTISGGTGDDTIYLTNTTSYGKTYTYQYSSGDGSDIIQGLTSQDTLKINIGDGSYSTAKSGSDLIVSVGSGSITVKNGSGKIISVSGGGSGTNKTGTSGNDSIANTVNGAVIDGLAGNDSISNSGSHVIIYGGDGNDSLYTTYESYYTTLSGGSGADTIFNNGGSCASLSGGAGNDSINNKGDYVTINGGAGVDTIVNEANAKILMSSSGWLSFYTQVSNEGGRVYQYAAGDGNDVILGFDYRDTLQITSGTFTTLKSGTDIIVSVGSGKVTLKNICTDNYYRVNIKDAADNLTVINDWKIMSGTSGADSLKNVADNVTVSGLAGNDTIRNSGKNVSISAGAGNDSVYSSASNVTIDAGEGNDTVRSYGSRSSVSAGAGNDYVYVSESSATVDGGAGDDTLSIYNGRVYGGAGNDRISITSTYYNSTVNGGTGDDSIFATKINDTYYSRIFEYAQGDGNDIITGFS